MTTETSPLAEGQAQIEEVARRYAGEHGLTPTAVAWERIGDDLLVLTVETASSHVQISFSPDEVEFYPTGEGTTLTRKKIRDKFASLTI